MQYNVFIFLLPSYSVKASTVTCQWSVKSVVGIKQYSQVICHLELKQFTSAKSLLEYDY